MTEQQFSPIKDNCTDFLYDEMEADRELQDILEAQEELQIELD